MPTLSGKGPLLVKVMIPPKSFNFWSWNSNLTKSDIYWGYEACRSRGMKSWFRLFVLAGTLNLCLVLSSCREQAVFPLGFSAQLSGPAKALGQEELQAVQLAVDLRNKDGGLLGKPISLQVSDDRNDVDHAVQEDLRMLADGVTVIIGHAQSSMIPAIDRVLSRAKVLYMSPTISSMSMSRRDDLFFRTIPGLENQGIAIASDALQRGLLKAACLYDAGNASFTFGVVEVFKETFLKGGGTIDFLQPFDTETVDYEAMADAVRASGASMVLLSCSGADVVKFANALGGTGTWKQALYGPQWSRTSDITQGDTTHLEGMRFSTMYEADPLTEKGSAFRQAFMDKHGSEPGFAAYAAWEAVQLVFLAVTATGSGDPEILKRFILGQGLFEGIHAPLRIDQYGDAFKPSLMVELQGKLFQRVGVYQ